MIASLRSLAVLAALALALGLTLVLGGPRSAEPVDHALLPGLDVDRITTLGFELSGITIDLVRRGGAWQCTEPPGRADPQAIDAVLSALRGGRWQRRGPRSRLGTPRGVVHVIAGDRASTLIVGNALAGTAQVWIAGADGDAHLVDGWIAAALAPEPLALRIRRPLDEVSSASTITLEELGERLELVGKPRQLDHKLLAAPELVDELERALAATTFVRLPAGPLGASGLVVQATGTAVDRVAFTGPCPGAPALVAVATPAGNGCVDAATVSAIRVAVARLRAPAEVIVDRRPAGIAATSISLPGATLELAHVPTLVFAGKAQPADPQRVDELLAALARLAEPVARPGSAPRGEIRIAGGGALIALELYDHVVARDDEPIALRPTAEAWLAISRPAEAYRDPTRWLEDASTIASITIDGATYRRGAVVGEWTGAKEPALVDALAATLATVRAPAAALPAGFAPARVIEVAFAPPVGAATTHHLELGQPDPGGCPGRVDGDPVRLPLAVCTAALAAR